MSVVQVHDDVSASIWTGQCFQICLRIYDSKYNILYDGSLRKPGRQRKAGWLFCSSIIQCYGCGINSSVCHSVCINIPRQVTEGAEIRQKNVTFFFWHISVADCFKVFNKHLYSKLDRGWWNLNTLKCCLVKPIHFWSNNSFIVTVKQLVFHINKPLKKLRDTLN